MTALANYSTGTATVGAGGTTVTGSGTIWSGTNVKPGDIFQIGNFQSVISDVTDTTHLVIPPWGGGAQTGVTYTIWQVSPQRFAGAQAMQTVNELVAAFNTTGFFVFVDIDETDPDPSLGDDGQYAFQPTTGKTWVKSAGVWTYLGIYKAFQLKGAWSGATAYTVGDVVSLSGSSYACVLDHTNHTPPNTTYWQLLASIGNTGNTGATGASYGGTSTTSLTIGTGSKAFTTQAGLAYTNGARVRASSSANTSNWMEGIATYSGTTLTVNVDKTNGSGTLADWNLNVVGEPGAGDLSSANNLSDVASAAAAATNLGVVRYAAAQSLTAAQQSQARANINVQKKNYLLNSGMMVSQENGTTAGTTSGYYPVDQFRVINGSGGAMSVAQVASATPGGSPNRLRFTVTTADAAVAATDYVRIDQLIEGSRVADLRLGSASAKTITVQFGVKAPAGTYCVTLTNSATNRSYVAEYVISGGEANTDVIKSVTIALDQTGTWAVDNTEGLRVMWCLMCGTTFQQAAGSWAAANVFGSANQFNFMGTNGNVFELFDVGLYEGSVAPSFQLPDYDDELRKCQRYYWPWRGGALGFCNGATIIQVAIQHPVTMRATPSIVQGSAIATADASTGSNINPSSASVGTATLTATAAEFRINNYSGLTTGQAAIIQPQSSIIAAFNARL